MANYKFKNKEFKKESIRVTRNWSIYQQAIFNEIESGSGNIHVEAVSGSGKTTTIVEGFYHMKSSLAALMVAFAKPIQVELEKRAPKSVSVKTLHSLGLSACKRAFPNLNDFKTIDSKREKLTGYIKAERGDDAETWEIRAALADTVSLAKGYLAASPQEIDLIIDRHGVDTGNDNRQEFIATVLKVMDATKKDTSRVDFDDMIWLPIVLGLRLDQHDYVFIDEAQDLNNCQISLALASCKPGGRILSVGDTRQAIYGFRGADENAINNIVTRMDSKVLPLSVTYRCAKSIAQLAQSIVPHFEYPDSAEDGLVENIGVNHVTSMVAPGDFILSRTNAPLIGWCLQLIRERIPANIKGRDVAKGLLAMIKNSNATSVSAFLEWLAEWESNEVERLVKLKRDSSIVSDKAECLEFLCENMRTLDDVKRSIDKLFYDGDDDKDRVILSTTHKAKGLERDRVFMLNYTYKPSKSVEESNLAYVAITRARRELYLVSK